MNIGEANAVNRLLDYIFSPPRRRILTPMLDLKESAKLLAKGSHKALMAGWTVAKVEEYAAPTGDDLLFETELGGFSLAVDDSECTVIVKRWLNGERTFLTVADRQRLRNALDEVDAFFLGRSVAKEMLS